MMTRQEFKTHMRKSIGAEEFARKLADGWVFVECTGTCPYPTCEGWRFEPTLDGLTAAQSARKGGITVLTGTMDDSAFRFVTPSGNEVKLPRRKNQLGPREVCKVVRAGMHDCPECSMKVIVPTNSVVVHECANADVRVVWHGKP